MADSPSLLVEQLNRVNNAHSDAIDGQEIIQLNCQAAFALKGRYYSTGGFLALTLPCSFLVFANVSSLFRM
jgi:hypothetical protein